MDLIRTERNQALDFLDLESLLAALDDDRADDTAFSLPLADALVPYRAQRAVSYVGSAGNLAQCPHCHCPGRVDRWSGYKCERCGFTNLQDRPTPRRRSE